MPGAEASGVRTRPPEPRAASTTPPLFGAPRLTPGAMAVPWPAAPRKREVARTRVGLGTPQEPAAVDPDPHAPEGAGHAPGSGAGPAPPSGLGWGAPDVADTGDPATRATERVALPVTESGPAPRGTHGPSRGAADTWALSNARTQPMPRVRGSATVGGAPDAASEARLRAELATTRKTQGLLRTPEAPGTPAGRYSVHDVSAEYLETGTPDVATRETVPLTEVPGPTEAPADAAPPMSEPEPADTRPRRSTPKQRVGHRRSTRPELGHARDRGTKRTDPGIRARTLRGNAGPAPKPTPAGGIRVPTAKPVARPSPPAPETASVVVDPSLTQPVQTARPPALPAPRREPSSYVPLPRDREAYEAFLRSAAGEHPGPPRARPSWAQQETALIPREALEAAFEEDPQPALWRRPWFKGALGVLLMGVSVALAWWMFQGDHASPRALEFAQPESAPGTLARAITLIATEPSGAELVLDGAVIGNTPLEVERPAQGDALYTVRLRGFEEQKVLVRSTTHEAIHVTLVPLPGE